MRNESLSTRILLAFIACGMASALRADPPVAEYVFPAGGQRGTTVAAKIGGLQLNESCSLNLIGTGISTPTTVHRTDSLWFEGPLLPLPDSQRPENYPKAMAASFNVANDAEPGTRQLLLSTSQGVADPLKFVVGTLPEVIEDELPGSPIPVAVTAPVTVNGRIFPREDIDLWSVRLKKGETLTAAVAALHELGTSLDAHLELVTPRGDRITEPTPAAGRDPVLRFTAPAEGEYHVRIRDAGYKGGPAYVYRLTLTTGPWVDAVFPLGGRRGTQVPVELTGPGIASTPVKVTMPTKPGGSVFVPTPAANPVRLEIDDLPEVLEPESKLPIPGIANGRIAKAGERDTWTFVGQPGEAITFELRAERLGSPLIGQLAILDSDGKQLAQASPGANGSVDPVLRFTPPKAGEYRIVVRDQFRHRGGPGFGYRLKAYAPAPGFELTLPAPTLTLTPGDKAVSLKLNAVRTNGYAGPIDVTFDGLPTGVTPPAKTTIAPNQSQLNIKFEVADDAAVGTYPVRVIGRGWLTSPLPPAIVPITAEATFPTRPGEAAFDGLRLAVAVPTPFKIVGEFVFPLQPRGTRLVKKYRLERDGYDGPVTITLAEQQARHIQGVTGGTLIVPTGATEFEYAVDLPPWMEMGRTSRVCVMGTATVRGKDGKEHVVTYTSRHQNEQIIAVIEPGRLTIEPATPSIRAVPGGEVRLPVTVARAKNLTGPVEVALTEPMAGVKFEPIMIAADAMQGELVLRFAQDCPNSFVVPLTIRGTVTTSEGPVLAEAEVSLVSGN